MLGWFRCHRTRTKPEAPFRHLRPGCVYAVVRRFADYDRIEHPVGERWTFLRHAFLPYEDGLTLFVRMPDGRSDEVRLQWRPESQGAIIDALDLYVAPAT